MFKEKQFKFRVWVNGVMADYKQDNDLFCKYQHNSEATIMEFTSIFDKNGVEIYDGDVVLYDNELPKLVIFKNGSFGVAVAENNFHCFSEGESSHYEVIGNIFENPNLFL